MTDLLAGRAWKFGPNIRHPSKIIHTFLGIPHLQVFFQKTAKYLWGHMKEVQYPSNFQRKKIGII